MPVSRTIGVVLFATLVAACTNFDDANIQVVIVNSSGNYPVHIYDSTGLVTGARPNTSSDPGFTTDQPVADPASSSLRIGWVGGECYRDTVIRINGSADALSVTLQPDARTGLPLPVSCSAVGIYLGVTLTLSAPVQQDAIDFTTQ